MNNKTEIVISFSPQAEELLLKLVEAIGKGGKKMFKPDGPATEGQIKFLEVLLAGKDTLRQQIIEKLGITYIADMTKAQASKSIEYLKGKEEKKKSEVKTETSTNTNQLPF